MNSTDNNARSEQQEIDASAKWPVIVFLGSALAWLIGGGVLQLIASIQLHTPSFLAGCEWFAHGRVAQAASNAFVYGWGFNAAFAVALWLMARLSSAALRSGGWLLVAAKFWNVGVTLGVLGILAGHSTSYQLLEMPRYVNLLLLGAYLLIGVWVITTFSVRNTENVYASQWWLFAAVLAFPCLYLAALRMIVEVPVHGTVQAVAEAWYVNGVYQLWFAPIALAIAYYFLPKLTGTPIRNYYLAAIGFWWVFACSAFAGGSRLIGGPVPSWVATLGTTASLILPAGLLILAVNLLGTIFSRLGALKGSPALRFVFLGILGYFAASILTFVLSLRGFAVQAQFTLLPELRDWLILYGCFSTSVFGAAYFFLPRLTGKVWRSNTLVGIHYIATLAGILAAVLALGLGGWQQGAMLNDATVAFADITKALAPWLTLRSISLMLLLVGHVAFLINFIWAVCPVSSQGTPAASFANPPALEGQKA